MNISYYANILQLVEDTTDNRVVASSSLAIRTKISGCRKVWLNRVPWEHEPAGSNPATQAIINILAEVTDWICGGLQPRVSRFNSCLLLQIKYADVAE